MSIVTKTIYSAVKNQIAKKKEKIAKATKEVAELEKTLKGMKVIDGRKKKI